MTDQAEQPLPQGKYRPAVRHGDIVYTSGMTPRRNGELQFVGQIETSADHSDYRDAVRLATQNALTAARSCLADGEQIAAALQLNVYLNAGTGFTAHSKLADFASEYLYEELGAVGIGSRAAIGVATLPSNAPVEITITLAVAA